MSGFIGVFHLDGAPVDPELMKSLTDFLTFRGPDAQATWTEGPVGLGHAMFRTTFEAENECQPRTLDDQVWIACDARIDAWAELKTKLAAKGQVVARSTTDADLILHAYAAWGEDCVEHLLGDFSFAIWDARRRRLFCARDHFGVKPFFHARVGPALVVGNTLDALRRHPAISSRLDDLAIADFLLFEGIQDPSATSFADIRRLPPGHCLQAIAGRQVVRSYWTLPQVIEVRNRPRSEYVEQFRHLLESAVSDRLRSSHIGLEMSGGLDSAAVASTAKSLLSRARRPFELAAHTLVYDRLMGSSRVDLQACKLEYSIVSPK